MVRDSVGKAIVILRRGLSKRVVGRGTLGQRNVKVNNFILFYRLGKVPKFN